MDVNMRRLARNFLIELVVYGFLVTGYFLAVLALLGDWLYRLYQTQLEVYGVLALVLIVAQAVVLESVTAFLVTRLGLERLE